MYSSSQFESLSPSWWGRYGGIQNDGSGIEGGQYGTM